jgi:flagellar motor switch protein FliG
LDADAGLKGARKAALFLMVMGEDFATQVFKHLDEEEVKIIGEHMAQVNGVEPELASLILDEFASSFGKENIVTTSGKNFLTKTVSKAFDSRKAGDMLEDLMPKRGLKTFEKLRLSPEILANLLVNEHPQTIALVLVHMKYQSAAEVIQLLPERIQSEVVVRIASLENVPEEIVSEVHEVIEEQLSNIAKAGSENLGGIATAAEILNHLDQKTETAILEQIEADREELAEEIRKSMFVFGDLIHLDDRSIRALLKEISNDELILALKTASENLTQKILSNVSQRAAQMMREDMEVMGPVRLKDVEQAQSNIIKVARRLEEEGKIILGSRGGDDVLV